MREVRSVMDMTLFTAAVCVVAIVAVLFARTFYRQNVELHRQIVRLTPPPRKSAEEQQDERLAKQLEAVTRAGVKFTTGRVMGRGEYDLFRAAMTITGQRFPAGPYPFFVFPQVSLGQIIRSAAPLDWQADHAHRAINSKRCDLLIADRQGNPVAVLEYQGAAHDIGGTAERRDRIKRIALEKAGIRYVEIMEGTAQADIQQTIRDLLTRTPAA